MAWGCGPTAYTRLAVKNAPLSPTARESLACDSRHRLEALARRGCTRSSSRRSLSGPGPPLPPSAKRLGRGAAWRMNVAGREIELGVDPPHLVHRETARSRAWPE